MEAYGLAYIRLPFDLIEEEEEYTIKYIRDARQKPREWGL